MKFLIAVDMEGCACVNGEPGKTLNESADYGFARVEATREASSAARALLSLGADEIIIWDNHGGSLNLDYDLLPEECFILSGVGKHRRFSFLANGCDAAILIGYHAKDNTIDGVLSHTFSSKVYQYIKVNGSETGEIGIDAMLLSELGIPVILVSGDDKACAEASAFLPQIITVEAKKALGHNISLSKHPKAVEKEIYESVIRAAKNLDAMTVLDYEKPVTLEFRFKRIEDASQAERTGFERLDAYTCRTVLEKLSDYFRG